MLASLQLPFRASRFLQDLFDAPEAENYQWVIIDHGGYFAPCLYDFLSRFAGKLLGVVEHTWNGELSYAELIQENNDSPLRFPILSLAATKIKRLEDPKIVNSIITALGMLFTAGGGMNQSLERLTNIVIIGYGNLGRGIALNLKEKLNNKDAIYICEIDGAAQNRARKDGFEVGKKEEGDAQLQLEQAQLIILAASNQVFEYADFEKVKKGVCIACVTSGDSLFSGNVLEQLIFVKAEEYITTYRVNDKEIHLAAHGGSINFLLGSTADPILHAVLGSVGEGIRQLVEKDYSAQWKEGVLPISEEKHAIIQKTWEASYGPMYKFSHKKLLFLIAALGGSAAVMFFLNYLRFDQRGWRIFKGYIGDSYSQRSLSLEIDENFLSQLSVNFEPKDSLIAKAVELKIPVVSKSEFNADIQKLLVGLKSRGWHERLSALSTLKKYHPAQVDEEVIEVLSNIFQDNSNDNWHAQGDAEKILIKWVDLSLDFPANMKIDKIIDALSVPLLDGNYWHSQSNVLNKLIEWGNLSLNSSANIEKIIDALSMLLRDSNDRRVRSAILKEFIKWGDLKLNSSFHEKIPSKIFLFVSIAMRGDSDHAMKEEAKKALIKWGMVRPSEITCPSALKNLLDSLNHPEVKLRKLAIERLNLSQNLSFFNVLIDSLKTLIASPDENLSELAMNALRELGKTSDLAIVNHLMKLAKSQNTHIRLAAIKSLAGVEVAKPDVLDLLFEILLSFNKNSLEFRQAAGNALAQINEHDISVSRILFLARKLFENHYQEDVIQGLKFLGKKAATQKVLEIVSAVVRYDKYSEKREAAQDLLVFLRSLISEEEKSKTITPLKIVLKIPNKTERWVQLNKMFDLKNKKLTSEALQELLEEALDENEEMHQAGIDALEYVSKNLTQESIGVLVDSLHSSNKAIQRSAVFVFSKFNSIDLTREIIFKSFWALGDVDHENNEDILQLISNVILKADASVLIEVISGCNLTGGGVNSIVSTLRSLGYLIKKIDTMPEIAKNKILSTAEHHENEMVRLAAVSILEKIEDPALSPEDFYKQVSELIKKAPQTGGRKLAAIDSDTSSLLSLLSLEEPEEFFEPRLDDQPSRYDALEENSVRLEIDTLWSSMLGLPQRFGRWCLDKFVEGAMSLAHEAVQAGGSGYGKQKSVYELCDGVAFFNHTYVPTPELIESYPSLVLSGGR